MANITNPSGLGDVDGSCVEAVTGFGLLRLFVIGYTEDGLSENGGSYKSQIVMFIDILLC
jgi:hypothetical protein